MKQGQFPAVLPLSSLNGQNGFGIMGEAPGDASGASVSGLEDINRDGHLDFLIGASGASPGGRKNAGRSYVVFGGPEIGKSGLLTLSSLNGANGFKLNGNTAGSVSGATVTRAGDINQDGYPDLLIGAWFFAGNMGQTYVVFGGSKVGNNGIIELAGLNGTDGFYIQGEAAGDVSGYALSKAGDINQDGIADFLIGAYQKGGNTGRTYVVYGGLQIGEKGVMSLSDMQSNLKLLSESSGDENGCSVSDLSDINGDDQDDLLIGALGAGAGTGRTYVVFGSKGLSNGGTFYLSTLNGSNGFKLDGEATGGTSGDAVKNAGDVNGDGYNDILIGATDFSSGGHSKNGRVYVVFGGPQVGNSGMVALSQLNGVNGFKIDGEASGDQIAYFQGLNGKIDINGDGYMDILIGACLAAPNGLSKAGRNYVVFGGSDIAPNGLISLSSLNGSNGFKLDGEAAGDYSGSTLSGIGDINEDGVDDILIGAYGHQSLTGKSYVIFGDVPPVLLENNLSLYPGESVVLNSSFLSAYDRNHDNNTLIFIPSAITHGQFKLVNNPDILVANFTQLQVFGGLVEFVHDGSSIAPSYNMTVRSSGIAWTGPYSANIIFNFLQIKSNQLSINQGQTISLTENNLSATDTGGDEENLNFIIKNLQQGQFEFCKAPSEPILNFSQKNISDGMVCFVHDGTITAPAYQVIVSNAHISLTAQDALIDFDATPVLLTNRLVINQDQTVVFTSAELSATHPTADDSQLRFDISALQQGQFSRVDAPMNPLTFFYQKNISDGIIQFSQNNSILPPVYNVSVTDGRTHSIPQAAQIDFDTIPVIVNNTLRINQGDTLLITSDILSAIHPSGNDRVLLFNLTDVIHGQFNWLGSPGKPILNFYQQNITDALVQFAHDNSTAAPGYTVVATDGRTASPAQMAQIDFDAIPVILNNTLRINQGEAIILTGEVLSATHPTGDDNLLRFNISMVTHGEFRWIDQPSDMINYFYQKNITDQRIQFTHDNSISPPAYTVLVTDGRLSSMAEPAVIDFDAAPILQNNSLVINQGQTITLDAQMLSATHTTGEDNLLLFVISNLTHGQFSFVASSDQSLLQFYQQNITDHRIQFTHDSSTLAPAYQVSVTDQRIATPLQSARIDFDAIPILENNTLIINQGQQVILNTEILSASHATGEPNALLFNISEVQHGQFSFITSPTKAITNFFQQNITDQFVQFIHDNSTSPPAYRVQVTDGRLSSVAEPAVIDFDAMPILQNNSLVINQGQTITLDAQMLSATHTTGEDNLLLFVISNLTHGQFSFVASSDQSLLQFYQQNITDHRIQFTHDNSTSAPVYQVSVTDQRIKTLPQSALIDFDAIPVLENNTLAINQGQQVILNAGILSASHATGKPNALLFNISDVQHGQFSFIGSPAKSITSFYQQNIADQSVRFIHDNSTSPPAYTVLVTDGRLSSAAEPAVVDFDAIPILQNNSLVINQGQTVIFNSQILLATHSTGEDSLLLFVISNLTHGQFNLVTSPDQSLLQFYQQNITDQRIQFTHDNSTSVPAYQVSVTDQRITTAPQSACIDFDATPVLINNTLIINQGQRVVLDASCLSAIHPTGPANALVFNVSDIQHGQFSWSTSPNQAITNFYQQNVTDGRVQFIHDNSTLAPAYRVSVTDGRIITSLASAQIDFDTTPLLLNNSLRINQGQTVILTSSDLKATHPGNQDNTLQFMISQLTHGNFSFVIAPQFPLKTFQQQNITDSLVQFTQDGSAQQPTYAISVTDGRISTPPQFAVIDFDPLPIIVNNQLKIGQGQTVTLTTDNLLATHVGVADPQLTFIITNISNGRFMVPGAENQSARFLDTTFAQQQIVDQTVLFYQQGTDAPAYAVSVSDGRMSTLPQSANITYSLKPVLQNNQFAVNKGQPVVLTSDNLRATRSGQALDTLQFLVPEITHGQYERRNVPGIEITSFYQKDITQQNIVFVHAKNSTEPPDGSLVVRDSSTGLFTDAQETCTLLLVNNYLPINQGETLTLTPEMLQAAGNQAPADNIVFTPVPGTVQYGNFALKTAPKYPISSFHQNQITNREVVFVPDSSSKAPTCYLTLSDGQPGGASGTFGCGVDFDTPPTLDRAYLSIAPQETVGISAVNLKASSTRFPASTLLFKISDLSHGFFADIDDQSKLPIFNFTQQQVMDNRILFTADNSSLSPHFQVSVWDSRMSCVGCPKPADVVFQSGGQSNGDVSEVIRNAIIGALTSGAIGLVFFAIEWYLRYKHMPHLHRAARAVVEGEEQAGYSDTILLPMAREVFSRIKITGCLGYINQHQYNEYVGAVGVVIQSLEAKEVLHADRWHEVQRADRQAILDAVAAQTKQIVGNQRCCSCRTFKSFYQAEASPRMIRDHADEIATAVQQQLTRGPGQHGAVPLNPIGINAGPGDDAKRPLLMMD